ncbi:hypothetical protein SAMN04489751_0164 [Brevibacterium sandarakinum]|uniref:Lipoprotein n=1 Tax=Brevibacterium sandarakinum TaxID=629680 RepID=A0A1H1L9I7_BRESA|nr:hypothetical protein [Brevibacterium sandarakinum]SDR70990.1 hypothetical protein SAMN04489751_0164 [Brevibacterium sandarakinum]
MKTGRGGRIRYRATTALTLAAALALPLVLSGCEDHSPVAAPTSTMPAKDPSNGSPSADPQPTVPAYETDLDLSPEETEAVEGALVAFEGFFRSVNSAYSGDFETADDFPKFASGDALESIRGDVQVVEDGTYEFWGDISPSKVTIDEVKTSDDPKVVNTVSVDFCFDLTEWSLRPKDKEETASKSDFVTMEHMIKKTSKGWRVAEQSLKEKRC